MYCGGLTINIQSGHSPHLSHTPICLQASVVVSSDNCIVIGTGFLISPGMVVGMVGTAVKAGHSGFSVAAGYASVTVGEEDGDSHL